MNLHSPRIHLFISAALSIVFFNGCNNDEKGSKYSSNIKLFDDTVINYNRQIVKSENQEIEDFIKRYKWKMEKSPTGLRYIIYHKGDGPKAMRGQLVKMNYSVRLLTGEEIYNSRNLGSKEFIVGQGKIESGLEEGILMLREGDRAKFIVPSHIAYGLLGDLDKVPERAALVYDIEVLDISTTPDSSR